MHPKDDKHHHHILPTNVGLAVGAALLVLTAITVAVAHVDLGRLNFFIAMLVATIKGTLVAAFFMNLKYDKRENTVIFGTSFLFLAIFLVLTSTDLLFRGNIYVASMKDPFPGIQAQAKSKFKKAWVSTPELVAHGKQVFAANCVACHGPEGKGDGPAAAALDPKPRNFTQGTGWKNGRKPSQVFKTVSEGFSKMPSFKTLPQDDRWSAVHFVLSLGPTPEKDAPADLAKIGVDPSKETAVAEESKTIPIEVAMERMAVAEDTGAKTPGQAAVGKGAGAEIYRARCVECHGASGEGGVRVRTLGVNPKAYLTTHAFTGQSEGLRSAETFSRTVVQGLPGDLMPGSGNLTDGDMRELFQYVKGLSAR